MFAQVQLFGWTPEVLLADAANYLSLSPQMARKHLKTLEEKGLIETLSQRPLKFQLSARGRGLMGLLEGSRWLLALDCRRPRWLVAAGGAFSVARGLPGLCSLLKKLSAF